MRTYDISPLWGSTIDFAGFFGLVDGAQHTVGDDSYLPHVECLSDDRYRISRALADSFHDEIAITAEQSLLLRAAPAIMAVPTHPPRAI